MARTKRVSKARKGRRVRSKRVRSKRMGKKRTKRSSKSSSRSNKRMRRSFIKKSRGRTRRSLRRMRGGASNPKYQYWKERNAEKRDEQRKLAMKARTGGFGDYSEREKLLAKKEHEYVQILLASFKKPYLAPLAKESHRALIEYYNEWPLLLSGKGKWIDPEDVYSSEAAARGEQGSDATIAGEKEAAVSSLFSTEGTGEVSQAEDVAAAM